LLGEQLLQLAGLVHLPHDVAAADEFAVDVELRDRRPVRVILDALAQLLVLQDVERRIARHAAALQDLGGGRREAALRELGRALHVQDDAVLRHLVLDPVSDFAHRWLLVSIWPDSTKCRPGSPDSSASSE